VPRGRLWSTLRRQTRLFDRLSRRGPPGRWALLVHEVTARRGLDLAWALLLPVPGVGDLMRVWLGRRLVCAFLGYEDAAESRVGCLLHPSRWAGREVRPQVAFALLRGVACGTPDYLCQAAVLYGRASHRARAAFGRRAARMNWYAFSRAARDFRPERVEPAGTTAQA
jgi:hypothetical protein